MALAPTLDKVVRPESPGAAPPPSLPHFIWPLFCRHTDRQFKSAGNNTGRIWHVRQGSDGLGCLCAECILYTTRASVV